MTSSSTPTGSTRVQQKAETRARVLAAAIEVFTDGSVVTTPLDAVARAAGVSKATLFFHFGSRLELLEALGVELYLAGVHSTFRPAQPGLATALRCYFDAQREPKARLLWEIGDVASAAGRPGPDVAYRHLIREIEARLAEDDVVVEMRTPLARVLAPAALSIARRAAFGQANADEQRRFIKDVATTLAPWRSGGQS